MSFYTILQQRACHRQSRQQDKMHPQNSFNSYETYPSNWPRTFCGGGRCGYLSLFSIQPSISPRSQNRSNSSRTTQGIGASRLSTPFPFGHLPYDIRVIIYSRFDTNPPLVPKMECLGFYLSCRQYKREIEECRVTGYESSLRRSRARQASK
ncbi:hypothetical protein M3J09_013694 [Ascochyta lentis]